MSGVYDLAYSPDHCARLAQMYRTAAGRVLILDILSPAGGVGEGAAARCGGHRRTRSEAVRAHPEGRPSPKVGAGPVPAGAGAVGHDAGAARLRAGDVRFEDGGPGRAAG